MCRRAEYLRLTGYSEGRYTAYDKPLAGAVSKYVGKAIKCLDDQRENETKNKTKNKTRSQK